MSLDRGTSTVVPPSHRGPASHHRLTGRLAQLPGAGVAKRNRSLRRLAFRMGVEPHNPRPVAPERPVGVKLELTYSCNLRCGFCYTDSPRRTLERSAELSDDAWRAVVDDAISLGVIEAVVTGGEPFLRRELTLEVIERLTASGVATCLNTNGWFVDEMVADRLAAMEHLRVHVSLDGPTPEVHDRARGVPGSWRRAVRALALLLQRGVRVQVVHVPTPDNADTLRDLIEQVWLLGVPSLRISPVVSIGAAGRGGAWRVGASRLERVVAAAHAEYGSELDIRIDPDPMPGDPVLAPAYLLVRPNGSAMAGSLNPFRYGHAVGDGLQTCWEQVAAGWNHPRVREWRDPLRAGAPVEKSPMVMYRDDEVDLDEPAGLPPGSLSPAPAVPAPAASTQVEGIGDLDAAHRHVRELALARNYRLGSIRWSPADQGSRYVRGPNGEVSRLNATAATVMDACDGGSPATAVQALASLTSAAAVPSLERDALSTARRLARRGVLEPALALPG